MLFFQTEKKRIETWWSGAHEGSTDFKIAIWWVHITKIKLLYQYSDTLGRISKWSDRLLTPSKFFVILHYFNWPKFYIILASSGPYGPLLARSGYQEKDAFFCNSILNLNSNVQSPSMLWWLITQPKPIWKKGFSWPPEAKAGLSHIRGLVLTQATCPATWTWP